MFTTAASIFSALLIVTGFAKLRRPHETAKALSALGPRFPAVAGLAIGGLEIAVGLAVLAIGSSVTFAIQGLLYLVFAGWVVLALRTGAPISSCGCLGRDDTPPYWGHVVLDVLAGTISIAAALDPSPLFLDLSAATLANLLLIGIGAFLSWVIIDGAARTQGILHP